MYGYDTAEYWRDEYERERDENRRERERQGAEREERRREMQREAAARYREAADWHEALRKQASLMRSEAGQLAEYDEDRYFETGADACDRALELWPETFAPYAAQIVALREQIARLERDHLKTLGKRLMSESDATGWRLVASTLIDSDDYDPSEWLNW